MSPANILLALFLAFPPAALAEREAERDLMVQQLQRHGSPATRVTDARVLSAMRAVPRHRFVPPEQRSHAYVDSPLSIGYGQTISQPYIVALMTQMAEVSAGMKVLEVGTGSGYQAAVLAQLTDRVYTLEIIAPLARTVAQRFDRLGLDSITASESDGYYGWEQHAPFDRIVVTAAASHIPPPLVEQLKPGGRMVIPVGPKWGAQRLMLVLKDDAGQVTTRSLLPVRFVPLTGGRDAP
jgi:protein-L-isoaspartate(D-aspartate) O-methyltransferase